ncbi:MAG TPA: murein transglycosylase D [Arsenophonus nasoniae]|uniref:murein transglycosylase D n=1 Tax=Arsenophonus nasoniae TaxID=638 RepID=UPI00387A4BAF
MKTKAILFASVLLIGCQMTPNKQTPDPSSANQDIETTAWESTYLIENDLWGYISNELKMDIPDNARIANQIKSYLAKESYLQNVTLRAEPYMYWIVEKIDQRNLPMELALVPIVESAFNPHATSQAQATGLWQIIPLTGQSYGLKQNKWVDERRDVAASTTAALNLLERLNNLFDGDWPLTLAAYNCGEGCVLNAIKKNEVLGLPTDYWSLSLPKETMNYVPKILALSNILRNSDQYALPLPTTNKNNALTQVNIGEQITLPQAARLSGLSLTALKAYNPNLKHNITPPAGPYTIMLPTDKAELLKDALSDQAVLNSIRLAVAKNNKQLLAKQRTINSYKVKRGDSLSIIAKRFNMTTDKLKSLNGMKTANLRIGQTLKISGKNSYHTATMIAKNSAALSKKGKANIKTYKVRQGDSYYSIAKRHGINLKALMNWNAGVKIADLKPGITLTIHL